MSPQDEERDRQHADDLAAAESERAAQEAADRADYERGRAEDHGPW